MADQKLSDLTALTTTSDDDLLYVVDDPAGTPADRKLALSDVFKRGTVTTSSPVIDAAQTWDDGAVTFTGLKFNATDTASAAASLLMDLQVGGASRCRVTKSGFIEVPSATGAFGDSVGVSFRLNVSGLGFGSSQVLGWSTGNVQALDTILTRRAAANLRLGAADTSASATITVTIAAPGVVTWSNHSLSTGSPVIFTTTGALPTGITAGTTYYAVVVNANTFQLASSVANAIAATPTVITTSGTQSGTHTGRRGAIAQQFGPQDTLSTGSLENINGADFVIRGSRSIGNKPGGSIIFQVAPAGSSGTAQNALATALTIASTKNATFTGNLIVNMGAGNPNFTIGGTNGTYITTIGDTTNYVVVRAGTSNSSFAFNGSAANGPGLTVAAGLNIAFASSTTNAVNAQDTILTRDAANTLALRNGANAQESRVYGSYTSATNFQRMSIKTLRESSGALSGASYTTTIAIPAYANLIGVTTRVTTEVTGATTYDVGDGTDVDLWGAAIGIALGSQSQTSDFTAVGAVGAAATSRTVTLTANGSNFTGGVVEICLHYLTTEAD